MHKQLLRSSLATLILVAVAACGSSPKVLVPPRLDLRGYDTIGILEFASNSTGSLDGYATQRFLETVYAAQPGVRVIELGPEALVLDQVGAANLDFEAARKIGAKYDVAAIFAGDLDVTDVRPSIDVTRLLQTLSAKAEVGAKLSVRLLDTERGATLWTRGSSAKAPVAHVRVVHHGKVDFGAKDPEEAYGKLVHALVRDVTTDFWSRWQ